MKVKVNIYNKQKIETVSPQIKSLIRKACRQTLVYEGFSDDACVDVSIVDNDSIRAVNNEYRNINRETDVLSFPLGSNGVYDTDPQSGAFLLGDIVLSAQKARQQSDLYGHSFEREVAFLTVHSMLHLLGYDHVNSKAEEKIMINKQKDILNKMGLSVKDDD